MGYRTPGVERSAAMAEKVYQVTGMTCGHCARSVSGEIGKIAGVDSVDVDRVSGRVLVTGAGFGDEQVAAAVDEAGYALANG
jgi:copper chaperone